MSKLLGKYQWVETKGWRRRAKLKRIQRRQQRAREKRAYEVGTV